MDFTYLLFLEHLIYVVFVKKLDLHQTVKVTRCDIKQGNTNEFPFVFYKKKFSCSHHSGNFDSQ